MKVLADKINATRIKEIKSISIEYEKSDGEVEKMTIDNLVNPRGAELELSYDARIELAKGVGFDTSEKEIKFNMKCNGYDFSFNSEPNVIKSAKYTHEVDEYGYSKLICILNNGEEKIFHFNSSNPMPKPYIVEGCTWDELKGICEGMFRMGIGEYLRIK